MRTPQDVPEAGQSDPALVGRTLTTTLLQARTTLPHATNGRPLAPSSDYVGQVRKEMATERSQEFKRIWAVCQCDLKDGVPIDRVTAALRQMLTLLDVEYETQIDRRWEPSARMLHIVTVKETVDEGALNVMQHRVQRTPDCAVTLRKALNAGTQYLSSYREWEKVCAALLHRVEHTTSNAGIMRIAR